MPSDQTSISTPYEQFTCEGCASELIQPLDWEQVGAEQWRVVVRCPECFQISSLRVTQEQANVFRNLLDVAAHSFEETADALDLQVFRETCDNFARALRADLICPMDF